MSTFLEVQAYTLHQYLWLHHSTAQTITGNSLNTIVGCTRPALTGVLVAPFRHRCLSCFRLQIIKMDSGRSGSKGKGFKAKVTVSTNQNSAHQNSDRTVCGSSESGSHPVSSSGTGCAPKDSASTMRNSAQSHIADKTTSDPCGSSSRPVSSSGTERAPSVFNPPSVWGSKKLDFSVGGHSIVVPMEGNSISSSETERAPSGFKPPSVWGSKTLDFSVRGHNIVVPTEGNWRSGAPSAELGSPESESGRSGSKGKGFKAKVPVSTNQNSAHHNSDRTVCGSCESGSHPVSSSGTGCAPKDSASTIRNSAQSHIADKTTSGPCVSSSRPVSSSGTKRAPSVFNPPSVWGSKKLDFSVGGYSIVVPMEGNSISSSETERVPSGFKPPSVWGSKTSDFSVGGHNIVVPTEGNSRSGAPSAELGSRESESMEVQENPHVVRESKGAAGGAIQRVERSPGKSVAEPSGSVTLQASSFDTKKKQRAEGSNLGVMHKGLSASSESKDQRGNKEDRFDGRRGDRGGRRGGYGSQRGEYDGGNRGGGGGGRGQDGSQRGESDRIDALGRLLSSVLRHRAVELKLNIRNDGYVAVEELLKLNVKTHARVPLYSHSVDDIREAVKRDNKQRFGLREEVGILMIRANQGHSIELVDSEGLLKPILSAEEVPVCVHGTYLNCLESIKKDGLKRMKRNHVHFARGLSKDIGVISGCVLLSFYLCGILQKILNRNAR